MVKKTGRWLNELPISLKIVLSFLFVILIGSILLSLPISQKPESNASYFDHLFTTVSMVCVTGLYTKPVYETYSHFGQWINILLIQVGGLGIMTIVAVIFMQLGKKVSLREEFTIEEALNWSSSSDFSQFIKTVVKYTFSIELVGLIALSLYFIPELGIKNGLFTSLYLSVSAFNNAGFDNFGAVSLQPYATNFIVNIVISSLIILGGIGFSVWLDVSKNIRLFFTQNTLTWSSVKQQYRKLQIHTQLVINVSLFFILSGTLLFLLSEWNNPATIGSFSFGNKILISYFQSVTMRTAGFATVDYTNIRLFSLLMLSGLMFVGGSPGGTAGGVKTSTIALVGKLISTEAKGRNKVNYKYHTISFDLIRHALVILTAFILILFSGIALIALFDPEAPFEYIVFEVFSALGTVGVTANLTPILSRYSQTILMFLMFIGRLGPITIFTALGNRKRKNKKEINYAKGHILIG